MAAKKQYSVRVIEVREVEVEYRVTAKSPSHAVTLAECGQTDEEAERGTPSVVERHVQRETLQPL